MNNFNLEEIFSQGNINQYQKYFSVPKVVNEANKIVDAITNTKGLTDDENIASILLAGLTLSQNKK